MMKKHAIPRGQCNSQHSSVSSCMHAFAERMQKWKDAAHQTHKHTHNDEEHSCDCISPVTYACSSFNDKISRLVT